MLAQFAPLLLSHLMSDAVPLEITQHGELLALAWEAVAPEELQARSGDLQVTVTYHYDPAFAALRWKIMLGNVGSQPLDDLKVTPLLIRLRLDPARDQPRVRHLSGSYHYDGVYPPRAFRVHEERIMTHEHCKPITLTSTKVVAGSNHMLNIAGSAGEHVPILQLVVGQGTAKAGFYVGFEWSAAWYLTARWARNAFEGEPPPDFVVEGNVGLGTLRLEPGEILHLPPIHLIFAEGGKWDDFDNAVKRWLRRSLVPKPPTGVTLPPVSYDHWFGIHQYFDVDDLKRQAARAAKLGCEYFCLDASWYRIEKSWADGIGNWYTPDPRKFPNGVEELSAHVRALGMGFGIWHQIEFARPDTDMQRRYPHLYDQGHLRLDLAEAREVALDVLRYWVQTWRVSWFRWESTGIENWAYEADPSGKLALHYNEGLYEVLDRLRTEFPALYIEGCQGGATKLDLGMGARTHGTWLSDHTANADVCRYMQTGAQRFWIPQMLNSAVLAHRGSGDRAATDHDLLSRMAGTFSFNGDIAGWSESATALAQRYVKVYKLIRRLLNEPVSFPLPQPRSDADWDVIVYGNEASAGRLLFAYRMEGADSAEISLPSGNWTQLLGTDLAQFHQQDDRVVLHLPPNSSALWAS